MLKNIKNLKKHSDGFTIIEVLIVLAIAGLIMVIVFLAVPALQRNARNTQRTNDATRIMAAINECLANNNGRLDVCNNPDAVQLSHFITMANNMHLTTWVAPATGGADTGGGINSVQMRTNARCNPAGNAAVAGGGARAFVLMFRLEAAGGGEAQRCIGS